MNETRLRSFVKSSTIVIVEVGSTTAIAYFITKNERQSLGIGLIDCVINIGLHFIFERCWDRIQWGYIKPVNPSV